MTELNLVPEHIRERKTRLSQARLRTIIIVSAFIMIFIALYIPSNIIGTLEEKEIEYKLNSGISNFDVDDETLIKDEVNKLRNYIDNVEKLKMNRIIVSDKIYNLQKYLPSDLKILNIVYSHGELTVSGFTTKYILISDFVLNLQSVRDFNNTRITSIKYNQVNNSYLFNIKIIFPEG
jgi:hypothetical protein